MQHLSPAASPSLPPRSPRMLGFDENRANILVEQDGSSPAKWPNRSSASRPRSIRFSTSRKTRHFAQWTPSPSATAQTISACSALPAPGVALHAKPAVAAEAKIRIDHGDLTALLYLQGYRKSDFITD